MHHTTEVMDRGNNIDLSALLDRAGAKERPKIEKHLAACDAEATEDHGRLWRRLATLLGELVPLGVQSVGNNAWRFFIPDGKYRMQVFALEDHSDGTLHVYLPDVLAEALRKRILSRTEAPDQFAVKGSPAPLRIEALESDSSSAEPPAHYKHMLGWNRKALRLTLPTTEAGGPVAAAAEAMLTLAAQEWAAASGETRVEK